MSTIKWFTVLIDSGDIFDHRVVVSPVDVEATNPQRMMKEAVEKGMMATAEEVNMDLDDAKDRKLFKVVAVFEGVQEDIYDEDEGVEE